MVRVYASMAQNGFAWALIHGRREILATEYPFGFVFFFIFEVDSTLSATQMWIRR